MPPVATRIVLAMLLAAVASALAVTLLGRANAPGLVTTLAPVVIGVAAGLLAQKVRR